MNHKPATITTTVLDEPQTTDRAEFGSDTAPIAFLFEFEGEITDAVATLGAELTAGGFVPGSVNKFGRCANPSAQWSFERSVTGFEIHSRVLRNTKETWEQAKALYALVAERGLAVAVKAKQATLCGVDTAAPRVGYFPLPTAHPA